MNDDVLICLVQQNDLLYNKRNAWYKDGQKKKAVWEEIGSEVGASGYVCSKRWTALREKYCRELRQMEGSSGSGATAESKWQHFGNMSFLREHIHAVRQLSNLACDSEDALPFQPSEMLEGSFSCAASPPLPSPQFVTVPSPQLLRGPFVPPLALASSRAGKRRRNVANDAGSSALKVTSSLKGHLESEAPQDMEAHSFGKFVESCLTGMEPTKKYKVIGDMTARLIAAKNDITMSACESSILKIKTFQFEWEIENICHPQFSKVFPQKIANEDFPQMMGEIATSKSRHGSSMTSINIIPQTDVPFYAHIDIFLFSRRTKEKVKIIEYLKFIDNNSSRKLANGFFLGGTVVLVFEVSLAFKSKSNEDELSAVKSEQDIPNNLINYIFDVTLSGNDWAFYAHKDILIARSSVFASMFQQEHQLISIPITDIAGGVFAELLRYMYTDTVVNLDTIAEDLLAASIKYEMPDLKLKCEEFLFANISIEKAMRILILSAKYKENDLKTKTLDYIVKNACAVINMDDWKDLAKNHAHLIDEAFRVLSNKEAT